MRVRWTEPSVGDLTEICDYIVDNGAPAAAQRVAQTVYRAVNALSEFPRKGRPGRKPDTRELPIPGLPYLAIYRIHNEVIEVCRILHGARQWPSGR